LSRPELVQDVLEEVPLSVSTALTVSSPWAFAAAVWNPLPSPPLSAAFAAALSNPVLLVLEPASTVMAADLLTPYVPVIVTGVLALTASVVIVKLREV
jgi:hypothetical protein